MERLKAANIDEYISLFPEATQKKLEQLRAAIRKAAPGAGEAISYAIPAFKLNDRFLIYFAGFKNHVSLYPAPRGHEIFRKELAAYKGGKGTVQFPLDKALPLGLIGRIIKFKVKENAEKTREKNKKKR